MKKFDCLIIIFSVYYKYKNNEKLGNFFIFLLQLLKIKKAVSCKLTIV